MKIENPPETDYNILRDVIERKYEKFLRIADERYFYWDEMKYRKGLPYPDDLSKSWSIIKCHRLVNYKNLEFGKINFSYYITESIQKNLHEFDLKLIGGLYKSPITHNDKSEYLKGSLLEEAIASSQVEGASTTTKVAFEMLKSERKPRNESEQMIFNNMRAIRFITEEVDKILDVELIIEIHRIMTANTSAASCAGSFRKDMIYVQDHVDGEIAHTPPEAKDVEKFVEDLCDFINSEKPFIHPIVKASILHFMFGYIHPFSDGNGRTARALFYWFLLKKEYSLIKNISISRAILNSRTQYDKAFLKTEHDQNDLTYFINYSIKSLRIAFESLINYRDKKKDEAERAGLVSYKLLNRGLNKRQSDLIGYLYNKKSSGVNISSYSDRHDIARPTARRDINELVDLGLLNEEKIGRDVVINISSKEKVDNYIEK